MPLVSDPAESAAIFREVAEKNVAIPCYGTENVDTTEVILRATKEIGEELGIPNPPIIIGFTSRYEFRKQLQNYTGLGDAVEGFLAARADMERLCRPDGPFASVRMMVNLDHAHPGVDEDIIEMGKDFLSSIMYDCSDYPMDENIRMTAEAVKRLEKHVLVEGCVDEIYGPEAGTEFDMTRPEDAVRYLEETRVPLIVVNVGTEHRAAAGGLAEYNGERARAIRDAVGKCMVLHGASSLGATNLDELPGDGFVKVNTWTMVERVGGQAVVLDALEHLDGILHSHQVEELKDKGWLTPERAAELADGKPSLDYFTHARRRDHAWAPAVLELLKQSLRDFGYVRLAG
ncbi:MAG: class II fructose-bisphosphate aldolase [Armatimonadota bacterium]